MGNIPFPEYLWALLAPLGFQEVTSRDYGEMPDISPEGLIMAPGSLRDRVLRQYAEGGGGVLRGYLFPIPKNEVNASMIVHLVHLNKCHGFEPPPSNFPLGRGSCFPYTYP